MVLFIMLYKVVSQTVKTKHFEAVIFCGATCISVFFKISFEI